MAISTLSKLTVPLDSNASAFNRGFVNAPTSTFF